MSHDRWAEVDVGTIAANAGAVLAAQRPGTRLVAVVKAGGYGHGAGPAARAALIGGASMLAVSTLAEAAEVRGLAPVLVIGGLTGAAAQAAVDAGCALMVHRADLVRALGEAARAAGAMVPVHLKVDTGMGRLGCAPEDAVSLARLITETGGLALAGTMTHLASAEDDPEFTRHQHDLFSAVLEAIRAAGLDPGLAHANNSAAAARYPDRGFDAVRVGIDLYAHALSMRALVTHVKTVPAGASAGYGRTWIAERETVVATVSAGYADGVMRSRSGRGHVLIRGRRAPVLGRISMDAITVDAGQVPQVTPGDVATLIGRDGDQEVTAAEVAAWSGTIAYEVLTAIGPRVTRLYPGQE